MQAKISRLAEGIELPSYKTAEAAGFDIAAAEDIVAKAKSVTLVRTGLVIEAPEGYFLMLSARSSLAPKKGLILSNGIGVVDRDYSGPTDEILLQVYNFGSADVEIKKGERLAQGMFMPIQQVEWVESSSIRDESRGGHGSTGGYSKDIKA
jgi:dUTP pyrophosphatase